jgi:hypothetical protein
MHGCMGQCGWACRHFQCRVALPPTSVWRLALCQPSTLKQGQYLAFIYAYTRLNGRPPAEIDMQRYFRTSPPSHHQMALTLKQEEFIRRQQRRLAASKCSLIENVSRFYASSQFSGVAPLDATPSAPGAAFMVERPKGARKAQRAETP